MSSPIEQVIVMLIKEGKFDQLKKVLDELQAYKEWKERQALDE